MSKVFEEGGKGDGGREGKTWGGGFPLLQKVFPSLPPVFLS